MTKTLRLNWLIAVLVVFVAGALALLIRIDTIFTPTYRFPVIEEPWNKGMQYETTPIVRLPHHIDHTVEVSTCARQGGYSEDLISAELFARGGLSFDGYVNRTARGVLYSFKNPEKSGKDAYLLVWGPDEETRSQTIFLLNGLGSLQTKRTYLEDPADLIKAPWTQYKNAHTTFFPEKGSRRVTKVVTEVQCAHEALNPQAIEERGMPRFYWGFSTLDRHGSGGGTWGTIQ